MSKAKKSTKKAGHVSASKSGLAVANYLLKALGEKDALKISAGMEQAATASSMKRKLSRIRTSVESASASAAA
jgi:hypothetical protein